MAAVPRQSLFESDGGSSLGATIDWVNSVLLGELAIGLSVIAVAVLGFTLLTGRLNLRLGGRVVLGIFVLLGAPAIASAFSTAWGGSSERASVVVYQAPPTPNPRADMPPADFDPYAGASLRRD